MAKLTQTGELLSDWLRTGGTLDPSAVWQLMDQLIDQVQQLHDSGQLHRDIRSGMVWIDQHNNASLRPAPNEPIRCGATNEWDNLPPELESIDELLLPVRIELAREALQQHDQTCDPRRIDTFQLGNLALELLTGRSVIDYLINLQVKAAVPDLWQAWIDSALGYNAADRAQNCEQLRIKLTHINPPEEDPRDAATPPAGTGIDLQRDTPSFGSKVPVATSKDTLPFAHLGQYRVDAKLGSGGMGDVYLGYDPRLDRAVAIKVLPPELSRHPDFVDRFKSEARAAAKLVHPHIVPIYFIGEENDHHFFVMEHVAGPTLAQLLNRQGALDVEQALELVEQVTSGLAEAHEHGLIHRDIKPGNILLDSRTGNAKLADFGLVKSLGSNVQATATGVVMGTVDYIAPEQGRGQAVDGRADLYSIGVLLYQLLSGQLPFTADSPTAMIFQHAFEQPTPLQEVASGVPTAVDSIVERLMRKDPDERYQTAQALVDDLRVVRSGGELSPNETPVANSARKSRIIFAPAIDSFSEPAEIPTRVFIPMIDQGWRTRVLAAFNQHAPDALKDLQGTQQQVDGAIAVYVSRRNELAALATGARTMEKELLDQITEQQAAAIATGKRADKSHDTTVAESLRQQQIVHQQTAEALSTQLSQQKEQSEQIKLRLAKVDATLQQLRSQQQLLLARLETAQAGVAVATAGTEHGRPSRRRRRLVPTAIAGLVLTAIVGLSVLMLSMGVLYYASLGRVTPLATQPNHSVPITKVNSASAAFGMVRKNDRLPEYQIVDFDVRGSDKLVVSIATERNYLHDFNLTYAGHSMTKAVQLDGATTVGIYYLDNPEDIAPRGTISTNLLVDKPNGAGLHAVSLSGTAPGVSDVEKGEVGNPFGSLSVSRHNSYVIAAAASDSISNSVRSNSPESKVSTEAPFIEVGEFNGQGNEIGSALAATAEFVRSPAQELTASFPGLSNRRNRESVVLAAFAPAKVADSRTSIASPTYAIPAGNQRITFYSSDGYVDTAPLIDLKKDAPSGNWSRDKDLLVAKSSPDAKPLSIPLSLAGSYSLGVIYRSSSPKSAIRLAFPVGSQRSVLRLGYNDGAGVALDGLDGINFFDSRNLAASHDFELLPNIDHKFNIIVAYKGELAQISVMKEFDKLIDWSGPRHKISPPVENDRHPFGSGITLACDTPTEIVFSELDIHQNGNSSATLLREPFEKPATPTSGHKFALNFAASSKHITSDSFRYNSTGPLTVEAWLMPRKQSGDNRALVMRDLGASSGNDSRVQLAATDEAWEFRLYDPLTDQLHHVRSPDSIQWDKWTHVTGVYNMNRLELFVNGKRVAMSPEFKSPVFEVDLLRIGAKKLNHPVFQGMVSQVRVSDTVRYQNNFEPETTFHNDAQVMALYYLDEGLGNLTRDASGNNHHGKIRYPRWCELDRQFP